MTESAGELQNRFLKKDLQVSAQKLIYIAKTEKYSDRLTLSAEKKSETKEEDKDKNYFRSERSWGKVERVISFPAEADPESAKANFKNGVLTVEVAEKSQDKAHKKVSITSEA